MPVGEAVVGVDLFLRLGANLFQVLANDRRQVGRADATAGEGERVVHQDHEPALGELVGPAHAAVVLVAMLLHHRVELVADLGDLSPAEVLVAAVIVECRERREAVLGRRRASGRRLRSAAHTEAASSGARRGARRSQIDAEAGPSGSDRRAAGASNREAAAALGPPGIEARPREPPVAKGKPRRPLAHQTRRPGTIGPDHVGFHQALPLLAAFERGRSSLRIDRLD